MQLKIGLSLAWTYLAGNSSGRCSNKWTDFFGDSPDFLGLLEKGPVSTIEFRHFDEVEDQKTIHDAARAIADTSFNATIHGDIDYKDLDRDFFDVFPWYEILMTHIPEKIKDTIITVHPVLSPEKDIIKSGELTVRLIDFLLNFTEKKNIPVSFALEIQRDKGRNDPGTTYWGLMELYRKINHPRLGLNWDMGHSQSNNLQGKLPPFPEESFLGNVNHTHIHDLNPDGQTHWPLTEGRIPLMENICKLERAGYEGIYNLELASDRFAHKENAGDSILESILILKSTILKCKSEFSEKGASLAV